MERKKKHLWAGIAFLVVSITVLYFNLNCIKGSFKDLWPALVLLAGTILYVIYFSTKKKKNRLFLIFLATFTAISSVPLFILTFTDFENINLLWPSFVLAFGLGVLSLYYYGKKRKIVLFISSLIIIAPLLAWIFYSIRSKFGLVIGVILFIVGVAFLTRGIIREAKLPTVVVEESGSERKEESQDSKENVQ